MITGKELAELPRLEPAQASKMEAAPNHVGQWHVWLDDDTQVFVWKRFHQSIDYVQFRRWGRVVAEYQIASRQAAVRAIVYSLLEQVDQHRQKLPHHVRQHHGGKAA